jgi:hypothetical protein
MEARTPLRPALLWDAFAGGSLRLNSEQSSKKRYANCAIFRSASAWR